MPSKTLLLLRHAKSTWDDPQLNDHDRPLNGRGRKAAKRIGRLIVEHQFAIELVLCSTAVRTRETAARVFHNWQTPPAIEFRDDLYHATPSQFVEVLRQIAEPTQCVMLIGHNPGLEEFAGQLTGQETPFPTAALALIEPDIDRWDSFHQESRGRLVQIWRPRELDSN